MKLSFVIPIHNVEAYLEHCLQSLYVQDLDINEFEVICVDDGSTDNSISIVQKYQEEYGNIIVHSQKKAGVSRARNVGVSLASGQYIMFIDSDDYIAEHVIHNLLSEAILLGVDMLYFDAIRVNGDDCVRADYNDFKDKNEVLSGKNYFSKYFPGNGVWTFLIKREFILSKELKFVEGRYCEDGMFVIQSTCWADSITYRHVDVYRYVKRNNSIVTNTDQQHALKMIDDFVYAIEYINEFAIDVQKNENDIEYISRVKERRDSYTFFLKIRILKACLKSEDICKIRIRLREIGCWSGTVLYRGGKYKVLNMIFSNEFLYNVVCFIFKLFVRNKN